MKKFIILIIMILITGCEAKSDISEEMMATLLLGQLGNTAIVQEPEEEPTVYETHLFLDSNDTGLFDREESALIKEQYSIPVMFQNTKPFVYSDDYVQIYFATENCTGQMYVLDLPFVNPIVTNHEFSDVVPGQYPLYVVDYNWPVQRVIIGSYMDAGKCAPVYWLG